MASAGGRGARVRRWPGVRRGGRRSGRGGTGGGERHDAANTGTADDERGADAGAGQGQMEAGVDPEERRDVQAHGIAPTRAEAGGDDGQHAGEVAGLGREAGGETE